MTPTVSLLSTAVGFQASAKDDLAARVDQAFAGASYLPDILVTPVSRGAIELTEASAAVIAAE